MYWIGFDRNLILFSFLKKEKSYIKNVALSFFFIWVRMNVISFKKMNMDLLLFFHFTLVAYSMAKLQKHF